MATPQPGPATLPPHQAASDAQPISPNSASTSLPTMNNKRQRNFKDRPHKRMKSKRQRGITEGSNEEILESEIRTLLASKGLSLPDPEEHIDIAGSDHKETSRPSTAGKPVAQAAGVTDATNLPAPGSELDLHVAELSATGDGLAFASDPPTSPHVYVVPFSVPGDVVRARVYRHVRVPGAHHSVADFLRVVTPSPLRDDSRIRCGYFARCGGCQLQMLDYAEQLAHKRRVVERAFARFAGLAPELIPRVGETVASPLQYGYRTKLTPHFDGPPGMPRRNNKGLKPKPSFASCPDVGFMVKGQRKVLDIEDCPIGTEVVRKGLKRERERMKREYAAFSKGATILLRESTQRYAVGSAEVPAEVPEDAVRVEEGGHVDVKTCVTDNNAISSEYVGDYVFTNQAGFFFQNNNSILPVVTGYIRDRILGPQSQPPSQPQAAEPEPLVLTGESTDSPKPKQIRYLIDAYSGSGLFTITLSSLFPGGSKGIDVSESSIACARRNASLNALPDTRASFMAADAAALFAHVAYDPDETAVVIDPPRKGCDAPFLAQLRAFGPRRVVYVSCNVHTQARDVGVLVRGEGEGARYEIESVTGFDFFPQTSHVEGVAILNRV